MRKTWVPLEWGDGEITGVSVGSSLQGKGPPTITTLLIGTMKRKIMDVFLCVAVHKGVIIEPVRKTGAKGTVEMINQIVG